MTYTHRENMQYFKLSKKLKDSILTKTSKFWLGDVVIEFLRSTKGPGFGSHYWVSLIVY